MADALSSPQVLIAGLVTVYLLLNWYVRHQDDLGDPDRPENVEAYEYMKKMGWVTKEDDKSDRAARRFYAKRRYRLRGWRKWIIS